MSEGRNRHPPIPARLKGAMWAGHPLEDMTREELLVVIDDLQYQVDEARKQGREACQLVQVAAGIRSRR